MHRFVRVVARLHAPSARSGVEPEHVLMPVAYSGGALLVHSAVGNMLIAAGYALTAWLSHRYHRAEAELESAGHHVEDELRQELIRLRTAFEAGQVQRDAERVVD